MSAYGIARRFFSGCGLSSGTAFRIGLATLLFVLLPAAASAYTLVLRGGRRVTVPDDFRVTATALTYEASPGFSVTVWLSNVDVAATERANAEPEGSFAVRIKREPEGAGAAPGRAAQTPPPGRRAGRRVVTDKELEPLRKRREAQEEEYERTRRERGMPSKQELRQRQEEQNRWLRERARQIEAERMEAELESLRSEVSNVRRQLDTLTFLLSRQAEAYGPSPLSSDYRPDIYAPPAQVITVLPFGRHGRFGRGHFRLHPHGGRWPQHPWRGHRSPWAPVGPSRNVGARPQALAPAMPAPRHSR